MQPTTITVSVWKNKNTFHIRVPKPARDKHLLLVKQKGIKEIHVEIDGKLHPFTLAPSFWRACNHFGNPVIREWLKCRKLIPWPKDQRPPKLQLECFADGRTFKLTKLASSGAGSE